MGARSVNFSEGMIGNEQTYVLRVICPNCGHGGAQSIRSVQPACDMCSKRDVISYMEPASNDKIECTWSEFKEWHRVFLMRNVADRIILRPGKIISANDAQEHYISGIELAVLYGLNPIDCIIIRNNSEDAGFRTIESDLELFPLHSGGYEDIKFILQKFIVPRMNKRIKKSMI